MIVTEVAPVLPFGAGHQQRTLHVTDNDCVRMPVKDAADYIATLAHELAGMAARNRLDVLRYLLEMAREEARSVAGTEAEPREGGPCPARSVEGR